ncbi:hypothetical protein T492DRAFT_1121563 [Pavlovales sp. CCMP2436]|nr:hypothetical protein T492DRAFT_1121563 [Pavlovales sp. CCMP2436]
MRASGKFGGDAQSRDQPGSEGTRGAGSKMRARGDFGVVGGAHPDASADIPGSFSSPGSGQTSGSPTTLGGQGVGSASSSLTPPSAGPRGPDPAPGLGQTSGSRTPPRASGPEAGSEGTRGSPTRPKSPAASSRLSMPSSPSSGFGRASATHPDAGQTRSPVLPRTSGSGSGSGGASGSSAVIGRVSATHPDAAPLRSLALPRASVPSPGLGNPPHGLPPPSVPASSARLSRGSRESMPISHSGLDSSASFGKLPRGLAWAAARAEQIAANLDDEEGEVRADTFGLGEGEDIYERSGEEEVGTEGGGGAGGGEGRWEMGNDKENEVGGDAVGGEEVGGEEVGGGKLAEAGGSSPPLQMPVEFVRELLPQSERRTPDGTTSRPSGGSTAQLRGQSRDRGFSSGVGSSGSRVANSPSLPSGGSTDELRAALREAARQFEPRSRQSGMQSGRQDSVISPLPPSGRLSGGRSSTQSGLSTQAGARLSSGSRVATSPQQHRTPALGGRESGSRQSGAANSPSRPRGGSAAELRAALREAARAATEEVFF